MCNPLYFFLLLYTPQVPAVSEGLVLSQNDSDSVVGEWEDEQRNHILYQGQRICVAEISSSKIFQKLNINLKFLSFYAYQVKL